MNKLIKIVEMGASDKKLYILYKMGENFKTIEQNENNKKTVKNMTKWQKLVHNDNWVEKTGGK